METIAKPEHPTLKESIIRKALSNFDWTKLRAEFDRVGKAGRVSSEFLGYLRRSDSMVRLRVDSEAETRRSVFLGEVKSYFASNYGSVSSAHLKSELTKLSILESGYRSILVMLQKSEISSLPAPARVSAYVARAAKQILLLNNRYLKALQETTGGSIVPNGVSVSDDGEPPLSIDAANTAMIETLSMSLVMEGYQNSWLEQDGTIVIPALTPPTESDIFMAGSTEILGLCWRRWRALEERFRFLGGTLEQFLAPNIPLGHPTDLLRVVTYKPIEHEIFDFIANERLNDRLAQIWLDLTFEIGPQEKVKGQSATTRMPPDEYLSADELRSLIVLSELLSYDAVGDTEKRGGLRFIEWVRGYCTLKCIIENSGTDPNADSSGCLVLKDADLQMTLEQVGLTAGSARRFIDCATFKTSSRDLFDCPLIKLPDGERALFLPAIEHTNVAKVVLSLIATLGEAIGPKGKAFESDILQFLKSKGHSVAAFTAKRDEQRYEFDAVLDWDGYVFVLECKNRTLSGHNPKQAFFFSLEMRSSAKQVLRLARALDDHPDILREHLGIEPGTRIVVPCVLNSMPYSIAGMTDGVFFTDASFFKRFFEDRYFRVKVPYAIDEDTTILHRTAMHTQWEGTAPTAKDLLCQLEHPFQFELARAHTLIEPISFPIADRAAATSGEFLRRPITIESYSNFVGVSAARVRKEMSAVSHEVSKLRKRQTNRRNKLRGR
ncbi:MAG: hypothetical protein GC190_17335 [Alphaproteobacteria bacterium]|nr:hypothetical protein [Alphaproteobacteria bacterium]